MGVGVAAAAIPGGAPGLGVDPIGGGVGFEGGATGTAFCESCCALAFPYSWPGAAWLGTGVVRSVRLG